MPRAVYRWPPGSVQVNGIECGDRWIGKHRCCCPPLARGVGGVAKAKFDPRGEFDVHPAFAEIAALYIWTQCHRRGREDANLLEHGTLHPRPFGSRGER